MKKILFLIFLAAALALASGCGSNAPSESPERIYNTANAAMEQGDFPKAIENFYILNENRGFKNFAKNYRCEIFGRLGLLLYKTERYDEAEKILSDLVTKNSKCSDEQSLKKSYILLIYIYMQELRDDAKAKAIRDLYVARFGEDEAINSMDRTVAILKLGISESSLLKLDAKDITIKGDEITDRVDREFFPVLNYIKKSSDSYDKRFTVKRIGNKKAGYYLYLTDNTTKKTRKLRGTRNGYAPQWSWDGRFIVFNAMDWDTEERKIKIYDLKRDIADILFRGKNVGDVTTISPDASKIIFSYFGRIWIMNRKDSTMALLSNTVDAKDIVMMAWGRDGNQILVKKKNRSKYHIYQLVRVNIQIIR